MEEKTIYSTKVKTEKEPIKKYSNFTLYQVYSWINNVKVPVYKVCE